MKKLTSILMVDDDFEDREMFRNAIQAIAPSLDVEFADNGLEAVSFLKSSKKLPDAVFTDINMPLMNGIELLDEMKNTERFENIPVIMYTTSPSDNYKSKCSQMGAIHYIVKPNSFKLICDEIQGALQKVNGAQFKMESES